MEKNIIWKPLELQKIKEFPDKFPITKESITSFVDILISNASARTDISEKAIKEFNKPFYDWLDFYFRAEKYLDIMDDSKGFNKLCSLFVIPIIENNLISRQNISIGDVREKREEELLYPTENFEELLYDKENNSNEEKKNYTHKECLEMFDKLSTDEKIKFIMEFQNIQIKLTPSDIITFKSC